MDPLMKAFDGISPDCRAAPSTEAYKSLWIMKKGLSIILTCLILSGFAHPVNEERILYVFPDDVETAIDRYMESLSDSEELRFVLTLYKKTDGTYEIFVNSHDADNGGSLYWERVTNRYAVINNRECPLLFDYDYDFGTSRPSEIGTSGERAGQVPRVISVNDGFHLTFSKQGICSE